MGYRGIICVTCWTDGGMEMLSKRVKEFLEYNKVTWTHSSTDTPQQNFISERNFWTMSERTLAMRLQSGLPDGLWWKTHAMVRYVTLRLITKTCVGYMSPMECVPGSVVPTHKWFWIWKCKTHVLVNRAARHKDWQEKAQARVAIESKRSKLGTTIDRDKRRVMKDGDGRC